MIPKNLQHDIFENDDKHRLVYLGAFAEAEEGFHKAEIAAFEGAGDAPNANQMQRLQEMITWLQGEILQLKELLDAETKDADGKRDRDELATKYSYEDTDKDALSSALSFAGEPSTVIDATNFGAQLKKYQDAFNKIKAMEFSQPISEWLPKDGDKSQEMPEIGLWNLSDLFKDGIITLKEEGLISLYNERGLPLQVPSRKDEGLVVREGEAVRNAPPAASDTEEGAETQAYLIPVWYGGQELYVNSHDVAVPSPDKLDFIQPTVSAGAAAYTITHDKAKTEVIFKKNIFDGGYGWQELVELAQAYEVALAGGSEKYAVEALKSAETRVNKGKDYASAISYANQALKLDSANNRAHFILASAYFEQGVSDPKKHKEAEEEFDKCKLGKDVAFDELEALRIKIEVYELAKEKDIPQHQDNIVPLLGGNPDLLYSKTLRGALATAKTALSTAPNQATIDAYKKAKGELEAAIDIESVMALEFFGKELKSALLDELYLMVEAEGVGSKMTHYLTDELKKPGGILSNIADNNDSISYVITQLGPVIKSYVEKEIDKRTDLKDGDLPDKFGDEGRLVANLLPLFSPDSIAFDELDKKIKTDDVITIQLEGKKYFLTRDHTQLEEEIKSVYADVVADLQKEITYLKKGFTKPPEDPLGRTLFAKGDIFGNARQVAHAKSLGKKAKLGDDLTPVTLKDKIEAFLTELRSGEADGGGLEALSKNPKLALLSPKLQKQVKEYAARYRAFEGGNKIQGGRTILKIEYINSAGEVQRKMCETPSDLLAILAEESQVPVVRSKLLAASKLPSMRLAERDSGLPGVTAPIDGRRPPGRRPERQALGREATPAERAEVAKDHAIAMNKWELEKLVYKGNRATEMAEVFMHSPVETLNQFFEQVEGMKDARVSDKKDYRNDWRATFTELNDGDNKEAGRESMMYLNPLGRPLILYNMIRRAKEEASVRGLNVPNNGNGDQWLHAMAENSYEKRNTGASDITDLPEVKSGSLEGFAALKTDLAEPSFLVGEARGYRVHVTSSPNEFPFIFKIARTHQGYDVHYGDGKGHFQSYGELLSGFINMILKPRLSERDKWESLHSYRIDALSLTDAKVKEYYGRFMKNGTEESIEERYTLGTTLLLKEISKDSKLPMRRLEALFARPHSDLLAIVNDIRAGRSKRGPGKKTLGAYEFEAAKIYLEKMGYKFGFDKNDKPAFKEGKVPVGNGDSALVNLRNLAIKRIEDEKQAEVTSPEKGGKKGGKKETVKEERRRFASVMERLEALNLRGRMALRAKKVYYKLLDHWLKKGGGGINYRDGEYNRFAVLAKNYKTGLENNLGLEFGKMLQRADNIKRALAKQGADPRGNSDTVVTGANNIDDAILRMAAIAARGEAAGMSCAVAHIETGVSAYETRSGGEGGSPRVRRSIYGYGARNRT